MKRLTTEPTNFVLQAAMKWALRNALVVASLAIIQGQAFAAETAIVDELGRSITVDTPVDRAVVFNSANVEFFRALGAIETVVGFDADTLKSEGYWPAVPDSALAGQGQSAPNYEAIVALRPDVVVIPRNGAYEEVERQLAPFNIPVVVVTGWDQVKHSENARQIGKLLERPERAEEVAAFYEDNMALLADRLQGVQRRSVYFEKVPTLYTPIPGSGWHDMVVSGGGDSIFADIVFANESSSRGSVHEFSISAEDILVKDPEVIIKLTCCSGGYKPPTQEELKAAVDEILQRPGWNVTRAVQNRDVHVVSFFAGNIVSKMIGSVYIAKALYPDRFADIDPDALVRSWLEDFQGVPYLGAYGYSALSNY